MRRQVPLNLEEKNPNLKSKLILAIYHYAEDECIKNECKCCINFHVRSGPKTKIE